MEHIFPAIDSLLGGETLTVEYKEDIDSKNRFGPYSEDKIAESLMALSNANGGYMLLGVDSEGKMTGVNHERDENLAALKGRIERKFLRPPNLTLKIVEIECGRIIIIYVPPALPPPHQLQSGIIKIRRCHGSKVGPENLPFPLSELSQWEAQRGIHYDFSFRLHSDLPLSQYTKFFNPLAVTIFRSRVSKGQINNAGLREIPNFEQQLEALGIIGTVDNVKVLTNAALILFGSNEILSERIPNHRVQFQAFGADGTVIYNLFTDNPGFEHRCLLYLATRLDELFRSVIKRKELMDGLFRIDVPDYGDDAVREAALNAFIHRDFTLPQEVVIQINQRQFLVTNPGGFYQDVTPQNILFHEPCSRNRCLAQVCADIGLVEKSGRGVDRIFRDQIRYMRPLPSYEESTSNVVRLSLLGGDASLDVIRWMFKFLAEKEDLTVQVIHGGLVHILLMEGRALRNELIYSLPGLPEREGRRAITELIDAGIITRIGHGKGQYLILSQKLQNALGKPDAFINHSGQSEAEHEKVMDYASKHGSITRKQIADLLHLPSDVNLYRRIIKPLVDAGQLEKVGKKSGTCYIVANVQKEAPEQP